MTVVDAIKHIDGDNNEYKMKLCQSSKRLTLKKEYDRLVRLKPTHCFIDVVEYISNCEGICVVDGVEDLSGMVGYLMAKGEKTFQNFCTEEGNRLGSDDKQAISRRIFNIVYYAHLKNYVLIDFKHANIVGVRDSFGLAWKGIDLESSLKVGEKIINSR